MTAKSRCMVIDKQGNRQPDGKERNGSAHKRILTAYDGSREAKRALDEGVRLADATTI
jgi:hypothetical protein